jgi:hypothetical protein
MKILRLFLVLLVGAGIGFSLGRKEATNQQTSPANVRNSNGFAVAGQESLGGGGSSVREKVSAAIGDPEPLSAQQLNEDFEKLKAAGMSGVEIAAEWARLRGNLFVSDLPTLASDLISSGGGDKSRLLIEVLNAWAEKDTRSALNFAQSIKATNLRAQAMHSVLQTAGRIDYAATLELVDGINDRILLSRMRSAALTTLAQRDPAKAFSIAREKAEPNNPTLIMSVLKEWTAQDPVAAQQAAAQLAGREGYYARQTIVDTLAQQDPQAAWEYAKSLLAQDSVNPSPDMLRQVVKVWAQSNPAKAIEAASTIPDVSKRQYALADAVVTWATSDLKAAMEYSISVGDEGARGNILYALAQEEYVDPAMVFDTLLDHAPAETLSRSVPEVVQRWARSNPPQAAAALLLLPAGNIMSSSAESVAKEWVVSSPAECQQILNWAASLPEGRARDGALKEIFSTLGAQDPAMASQLINSSAAINNSEALEGLIQGWSSKSPADAARYALSNPAISENTSAIRDIIRTWSRASPMDAAAFIQSSPEDMRPFLAEALVDSWATIDLQSAATWVKAQPVGPSRDAGISAILENIRSADPEKALEWSQSMSDEEKRSNFSESILRSWFSDDPNGARAWLAKSQAPQELRNKFATER